MWVEEGRVDSRIGLLSRHAYKYLPVSHDEERFKIWFKGPLHPNHLTCFQKQQTPESYSRSTSPETLQVEPWNESSLLKSSLKTVIHTKILESLLPHLFQTLATNLEFGL